MKNNRNLEFIEMEIENDYTQYIPTHPKRLRVYEKFYNLLKNTIDSKKYEECENYNENDIMKMALNLERGIFNYVLDKNCSKKMEGVWNDSFRTNYIHRCVTIYTNLDPNGYIKNFSLMKRLLSKELDEFKLTQLSQSEIFPEKWNEFILKYEKELLKDLPVEKEHEDGILQCRKCKSFKTEYNEVQTRGSDESTTKLCYCHNCSHRWRFC
jgi:DNA-directed RNA polymerase subunit M/transcription elongation factor TFIIS